VATGSAPATGEVRRSPADAVTRPVVPTSCPDADLVPSGSNLAAVDAATLCLINQARRAAGLAVLAENAELRRAAVEHSDDMVARDYFGHVDPDGIGPAARIRAAGFVADRPQAQVAENIAAATISGATPAATVASWMSSPGHRANILDPAFRVTGIGVAGAAPALVGTGPGATYTEDFA